MLAFLIIIGYILIACVSLAFVAWRKVNKKISTYEVEIEIVFALVWPAGFLMWGTAGAGKLFDYLVWKPTLYIFNKMIESFTPKPEKIPVVDETKSTYRNVAYEKE